MADTATPSSRSTLVRLRDLSLLADVGINPEEIGQRQPLVVSVEITLRPASTFGAIGETVDYRKIAAAAEDLAQTHIPLIESFAHRLAARCLALAGAEAVRVTVDKPFALARGMAGVEVRLRR